jgi:hypothetical protein
VSQRIFDIRLAGTFFNDVKASLFEVQADVNGENNSPLRSTTYTDREYKTPSLLQNLKGMAAHCIIVRPRPQAMMGWTLNNVIFYVRASAVDRPC